MALKTLENIQEIGGFEIGTVGKDSLRVDGKNPYITIDHFINEISFRIQDGPIKEVGVNGCQVDTMVMVAAAIIEGLNKEFPCAENLEVMWGLNHAILWLDKRRENREARNVEGLNLA